MMHDDARVITNGRDRTDSVKDAIAVCLIARDHRERKHEDLFRGAIALIHAQIDFEFYFR